VRDSRRPEDRENAAGIRARWKRIALGAVAIACCEMLLPSAFAQNTTAPSVGTNSGASGAGSLLPPQFSAAATLEEAYTTNAAGLAETGSSDEFTRLLLSLGYLYSSSRLQAVAHYTFSGDYYLHDHNLDHLTNHLNLLAKDQIIPDNLSLTVEGFATPLNESRLGAISASGEPISNLNSRDTYGYLVEPDYHLRFDDFADSDLIAKQMGVFFVSPGTSNAGPALPFTPPTNELSTGVTERITSGTDFERMKWELSGSDSQSTQANLSESQQEGAATVSYAVNRILRMVGTGGYDFFKSSVPLTTNLNGPIGLGGIEASSGPPFLLLALAGTQHNFFSYIGKLHWEVDPLTTVVGSATDQIVTPQDEILGALGSFGATPNGDFFDSLTQADAPDLFAESPDLNSLAPAFGNGLALTNAINRVRNATLTISHDDGRMTYQLGLFDTKRDPLSIIAGQPNTPSSLYGARLGVQRQIWPDLTGGVNVEYSAAQEFGGDDQILSTNGTLNYVLADNMRVFLIGRYLRRLSSNQSSVGGYSLSDIQAIVGISRNF
jgi:uncharacterized protein (PEP-CTERM system associated)